MTVPSLDDGPREPREPADSTKSTKPSSNNAKNRDTPKSYKNSKNELVVSTPKGSDTSKHPKRSKPPDSNLQIPPYQSKDLDVKCAMFKRQAIFNPECEPREPRTGKQWIKAMNSNDPPVKAQSPEKTPAQTNNGNFTAVKSIRKALKRGQRFNGTNVLGITCPRLSRWTGSSAPHRSRHRRASSTSSSN